MRGRQGKEAQPLWKAAAAIAGYAVVRALLTPQRDEPREAGAPFGARRAPYDRELHRQLAREPGRGREARWFWQIPWAGWKDILRRTVDQIQANRMLAVAAGVVFYTLLALFPATTAIVSLYGLFTQPATIEQHISLIAGFTPEQAVAIIREQVERLVARDNTQLGFGFAIGLGIALWSANAGMKAIIDALNVVYNEEEKRGFVRLTLVSFMLTLGAIFTVLAAIGAVVVLPLVFAWIGFETVGAQLIELGRWPAVILLILLGLAVLYRFGPSRERPKWRWLTVGSVVATLLWIAGSAAFSYYIQNLANFDATYGSLATGIGLMLWMWISVIVVLLGAELNAEIEHQTAVDTTEGPARPMGRRGAVMADSVGKGFP